VLFVDPGRQAYPARQLSVQEATGMAGVAPYRPAAQEMHTPAPERLYCPAGKVAAVALVDPAMHAYPALQLSVQDATGMAGVAPNRPAAQEKHTPAPDRLYLPAGHVAAVALVDPAMHAYPAVQLSVQEATGMAGVAPYRPAAQEMHTPAPDRLYFPGGHVAAVALVDPAMHAYPAVQLPLHAAVGRPVVDPNVPAGHAVHDETPPREY
jgi:hypothetical protein